MRSIATSSLPPVGGGWHRCWGAIAAALLGFTAMPASADSYNGAKVALTIDGQTVISGFGGGPNVPAHSEGARNQGGVLATLMVDANQFTGGKVDLRGTGVAVGKVQANSTYPFKLVPPAGANVKGGKLVLHVVLEGSAIGDADVHALTAVQSDFGKGEGSAIISDANTPRVAFDVVTSIASFIEDIEKAGGTVHMHIDATAKLSGGAAATSVAVASNNSRVTGFAVFNGAGTQVTGFKMVAVGGDIPEVAGGAPSGIKVAAVEFYNATYKHYFVTASTAEIAKLDDGTFAGWTRSGQQFNVFSGAGAGLAPVCRFYTVAFPPSSSHFYAPRGLGCEGTLTDPAWQYEGDVMYVPLPNATGACPAGTLPVYRLYNNRQGGAPNHRFTTSEAIRTQMLAQNYIAEGAGIGVGFCSPQ